MDYSRKIDWQINNSVKTELVKRWIDTSKVRIFTTKGNIEIRGTLEFIGQGINIYDSPTTIMNMLRTLELAIKAISNVRNVKFEFDSWKKTAGRWEYTPSENLKFKM